MTCPVLRVYTCPHCGANGDAAHTLKHCPENTQSLLKRPTVTKKVFESPSTEPATFSFPLLCVYQQPTQPPPFTQPPIVLPLLYGIKMNLIAAKLPTAATKKPQVCVFCRNNGQTESFYTSHNLKDTDGKVTCIHAWRAQDGIEHVHYLSQFVVWSLTLHVFITQSILDVFVAVLTTWTDKARCQVYTLHILFPL